MKKNGFSRDFTLVVIGQIISLFGNAVVRFALPLHLLNISQSLLYTVWCQRWRFCRCLSCRRWAV